MKTSISDYELQIWKPFVSKEESEAGLIKSTCYKWLDGNAVVATVTVEKWPDQWTNCNNLEVFEPYRRRGLSHQVIEFAKFMGVNNLSVAADNCVAIQLYQKHGFYFTGERDGDYLRMRLSKEDYIDRA